MLARQARAALAADHPDRADDAALAEELREAIPLDRRIAYGGADDLDHGRHLVRRRWLRRGLAAAVAVALLVTGVVFLVPDRAPAPAAAPPVPSVTPSPTPTPIDAGCDPTDPTLPGRDPAPVAGGDVGRRAVPTWIPEGDYFSGFGYRYDERYDDPGFWTGQGGALAFEMFRLDAGATTVYLQIATSRPNAVRCGETVGRRCSRQKFLDGNFFNLTNTVSVRQGMEVQYRPDRSARGHGDRPQHHQGPGVRHPARRPDPPGPGPAAAAARRSDVAGLRRPGRPRSCRGGRWAAYGSARPGRPGRSTRPVEQGRDDRQQPDQDDADERPRGDQELDDVHDQVCPAGPVPRLRVGYAFSARAARRRRGPRPAAPGRSRPGGGWSRSRARVRRRPSPPRSAAGRRRGPPGRRRATTAPAAGR